MRILVANPNATAAITDACLALARGAASPGTELTPWTNRAGPPLIDSFYGDYMAGRPLASALARVAPQPDAVVLAGFGNYGTAALKEALEIPVIGMAEAAMALATPFCHRFAIVTTAPRMIPYTQDLVTALGFEARCVGVRAVSLSLAASHVAGSGVLEALVEEVRRVSTETGADLVILGGSLLSPYAEALRPKTPLVVVEPLACAVQMAEAAIRLGLRQSKLLKFALPPRPLGEYG